MFLIVVSYFFIFCMFFFNAAQISYTFGCHYYPTNLNSLNHCICVHQGTISTAVGLVPGTAGLRVNHANNELSWRHCGVSWLNCSVPGGPLRLGANTRRETVHVGYTPVRVSMVKPTIVV